MCVCSQNSLKWGLVIFFAGIILFVIDVAIWAVTHCQGVLYDFSCNGCKEGVIESRFVHGL